MSRAGSAVVTGAGGGLGAAVAARLAADGWPVLVNDVDVAAAQRVADAVVAAGGTAAVDGGDATSEEQVGAMVQRARDELGPVLVTVANASGPQGGVDVEDLTWAHLLRHLEFFARSPLALLQAALPDMRSAGWGRVVHVGSDLFDRGDPGWSAYMAAKGAMLGLTRGWAADVGRDGVTVNLVSPGWIPVGRHGTVPPDVERAWLDRQAVPRWGRPDDVAAAVSYLVRDEAGFVSGQRVVVNGGFHFA